MPPISSPPPLVGDRTRKYLNPDVNVRRVSTWLQVGFALFSIAMVPAYAQSQSIMQTIQALIGLFSMPILSAFIIGLLFRNVDARAVIATILFGSAFYALFAFAWPAWHASHPTGPAPWHFLHSMALTVWACVGFALTVNRLVFGKRAEFELRTRESWRNVWAALRA